MMHINQSTDAKHFPAACTDSSMRLQSEGESKERRASSANGITWQNNEPITREIQPRTLPKMTHRWESALIRGFLTIYKANKQSLRLIYIIACLSFSRDADRFGVFGPPEAERWRDVDLNVNADVWSWNGWMVNRKWCHCSPGEHRLAVGWL